MMGRVFFSLRWEWRLFVVLEKESFNGIWFYLAVYEKVQNRM